MDSSIYQNIANRGWTFVDSWLVQNDCRLLKDWAEAHQSQFSSAGIGKNAELNPSIRGDRIFWLSGNESKEISEVFQKLNHLKSELNRELQLPINNFEAHFAVYPPQTQYQAHIDQNKSSTGSERLISFVLYFNPEWTDVDGGQLTILGPSPTTIQPLAGRLVLFRSQDVLHAVNKTYKVRWSMTGWFRRDSF